MEEKQRFGAGAGATKNTADSEPMKKSVFNRN